MNMHYTAIGLLTELQRQGVFLQVVSNENLHVKGELTEEQLNAVRQWKPQIISAIRTQNYTPFRFAENEYLFNDLKQCFSVFEVSNVSALRLIQYLLNYCEKCESSGVPGITLNQPTTDAYISELNLIDGLLKREKDKINDRQLKILADKYISTHREGMILADWLQDQDAPLYAINIRKNGERFEFMIGNTIQVAISAGYWQAKDPEITVAIAKA